MNFFFSSRRRHTFFFQAEDGIRDRSPSRGLGDVYKRQALSLFAYAGITDLVDGYIARRYNLQTVVGTIIDPMADKLLMTIGVACLAVNGSLPGKSAIDSLGMRTWTWT